MELKIINTNENKANEIYSSTDCQQLINSMDESNRRQVWTSKNCLRDEPDKSKASTDERILDCHHHYGTKPG